MATYGQIAGKAWKPSHLNSRDCPLKPFSATWACMDISAPLIPPMYEHEEKWRDGDVQLGTFLLSNMITTFHKIQTHLPCHFLECLFSSKKERLNTIRLSPQLLPFVEFLLLQWAAHKPRSPFNRKVSPASSLSNSTKLIIPAKSAPIIGYRVAVQENIAPLSAVLLCVAREREQTTFTVHKLTTG